MRRIAIDFYSKLYTAESSDKHCRSELLKDLPVLFEKKKKKSLDTDISFEEVSLAVMGMSSGRSPGLDGLPAEFYKTFWSIIGHDLKCFKNVDMKKFFQPVVNVLFCHCSQKKGFNTPKELETCRYFVHRLYNFFEGFSK